MRKILSIISLLALIAGLFPWPFFSVPAAQASWTYRFRQSDWSGGQSANYPSHPANETTWTYWGAKDTGITAGGNIVLAPSYSTKTQTDSTTTITGFNLTGRDLNSNKITIQGSGDSAYVRLSTAQVDLCDTAAVSYGGDTYNTTAQVGRTQCWLKKNLNVGTQIAGVEVASVNGLIEKYCYEDNAGNCSFGALYTWEEAMGEGGGICPSGWDLPTDSEWFALEDYLKTDGQACDPNRTTWSCSDAGTDLKSGTFAATLIGRRNTGGSFSNSGYGYYWSSSMDGASAYLRDLYSSYATVQRSSLDQDYGFFVRCLKDTFLFDGYETDAYFTSGVLDPASQSVLDWGTFSWNANLNSQALSMEVRSCNADDSDCSEASAWGSCAVTSGADISSHACVDDGDRYVQYRAHLHGNSSATPELLDVTVGYTAYAAADQTLTSSAYNTRASGNVLAGLSWSEAILTGTDVKLQLQTAPDSSGVPGTWTAWCGPDDGVPGFCSSSTYFTNPNGGETIDDIQRDGSGDQWLRWKATLSSDGANVPALDNVVALYTSSVLPEIARLHGI